MYKLGKKYKFKNCGHIAILPVKYGISNDEAFWINIEGQGNGNGAWVCNSCYLKNLKRGKHRSPATKPGEFKCRKCNVLLTGKNANLTVYHKGGLCVKCGSPFLNNQKEKSIHTFKKCGHTGRLPETGKSNSFAYFVGWKGGGWCCRACFRVRARQLKLEVYTHYCNGIPYCQCKGCRNGKSNPVHLGALQTDHIDGRGAAWRRNQDVSRTGSSLLQWLKKNNYPKGFQVLCANCNNPGSKGTLAECPEYGKSH